MRERVVSGRRTVVKKGRNGDSSSAGAARIVPLPPLPVGGGWRQCSGKEERPSGHRSQPRPGQDPVVVPEPEVCLGRRLPRVAVQALQGVCVGGTALEWRRCRDGGRGPWLRRGGLGLVVPVLVKQGTQAGGPLAPLSHALLDVESLILARPIMVLHEVVVQSAVVVLALAAVGEVPEDAPAGGSGRGHLGRRTGDSAALTLPPPPWRPTPRSHGRHPILFLGL